ncbi:hypothetical protein ACIRG4_33260 [Streptomyces sp. NPDC102395]|uniref:DUF3885 domain-containing protein n=1 Tax=Streptomyces sp. NPDC102395 TaxID=3366168 RepID=UPI00382F8CDA
MELTADDKVARILITHIRMQRIHHPYDGGADVFLTTSDERDQMRDRHTDGLPVTPRVSDRLGSPPRSEWSSPQAPG